MENEKLIELTAEITAAHVANNNVASSDVASVIRGVFAALGSLVQPSVPVVEKPKPAVPVRSSIKPDHLISLIDGKSYKLLKRHLTLNGYTPETYREAFGLPRDYPMVSENYSIKRRGLALKIGLGRKAQTTPVKLSRKEV